MSSTDSLLRALREEESRVTAPPHLERAVLGAWDAAHTAGPKSRARWSAWRAVAAAAAALVMAVTLTALGTALHEVVATEVRPPATLVFVGEPIRRDEPVRIVRMRLPVSMLGAIGVRPAAGRNADVVDVDLIVGEDGVARAIRLGM